MLPQRLRIGLISVYFPLFDDVMPADFRKERELAAGEFAETLRAEFDVLYPGLLTSEEDGSRVNATFRAERLDAIVFAPSMAAPPSFALVALEGLDAPVVVWNAPAGGRLGDDITQADATANSTQVGSVMLANVLVRTGRPFVAVTASLDDRAGLDRLLRTVRGAAAATALRGAIALRIGDPIPGYADVEATSEQLASLGVSERRVSIEELNEAFRQASPARPNHWHGSADPRSTRLAGALADLVERHRASLGTVNCHGDWLRFNPEIGICACLGVSLLTGRDVPFSCTGDQPTALALLIARRLSGRALYCEFYAPELDTGLMLLAAGGEGDPAWADASGVRIEANHHYPGLKGAGAAIAFDLEPRPATVISLSPISSSGWRLVWATGEIVETRYRRMGGPNAMFQFDTGPSNQVATSWIESGATHHNALALGRLDDEIPVVAGALGVEAVRV